MSGEHAFLVDARQDRFLATLRFDGRAFVPVDAQQTPLPDRSAADFQDVLVDPLVPDRFHFIDSRGERLISARYRPPAGLEVLGSASLKTSAFRTSPNWGIWL
jgi:hypothetical protein